MEKRLVEESKMRALTPALSRLAGEGDGNGRFIEKRVSQEMENRPVEESKMRALTPALSRLAGEGDGNGRVIERSMIPLERRCPAPQRRVRIRFDYPLGDLVVFAGALRELHRCHPGEFEITVESSIAEFWQHCPHARAVDPLPAGAPGWDACEPSDSGPRSPLVVGDAPVVGAGPGGSETYLHVDQQLYLGGIERPRHMLQSFVDLLNERLGTSITVADFRGEAPLSEEERAEPGPVEALLGRRVPYWIVCNGGKFDRTVKWWPSERYQEVVSAFQDRLLFVQVGRSRDYHPKIEGALDFRGWSGIRTLLRLVYWSEGVVCPITSLMHLAAAVPRPPDRVGLRPCVVVGGGIEPPHWSAYPGHRFLSVVGALPCSGSGCWKSRTLSLGDGAPQDAPEQRCVAVEDLYPRCMRMIRSEEVIRAVEGYVEGGMSPVLGGDDVGLVGRSLGILRGEALDDGRFTRPTARLLIERQVAVARRARFEAEGRGIVTLASGMDYVASAWVMVRLQRHLGCRLPVQVWLMGDKPWLEPLREAFRPLDAEVGFHDPAVDARCPRSSLFAAKPEIIAKARFREVLWLDADSFPACDPTFLFSSREYWEHGALFWPEPEGYVSTPREAWLMFGLPEDQETSEVQGGEMVFDKGRVSPGLWLARWCNRQYRHIYTVLSSDKDIFRLAFRKVGQSYAMPPGRSVFREGCLFQNDFEGNLLFQHRVASKVKLGTPLSPVAGFLHARECQEFLDEFIGRVKPRLLHRGGQVRAMPRETGIAIEMA